MPQIINSNISSLNAQRNLDRSQSSLKTSLQRLSSGLRINSAKDDAAGMAISSRMSAQISGLTVARRNANDGVSLSQTAEAALSTIGDNLTRMRDLAVQAANATNTDADRAALNQEIMQLQAEIARVGEQTNFNGQKLLDGTFTNKYFQIGANAGEGVTVNVLDSRASAMGSNFVGEQLTVKAAVANSDIRFQINGEEIYANVAAASDQGTLKDAINAAFDKTGVKAEYAMCSDGVTVNKAELLLSGPSFTLTNGMVRDSAGVYQASSTGLTITGDQGEMTQAVDSTINNVAAQKITITGEKGTDSVQIAKGDSAKVIVDKINASVEMTGVEASARTTATLSNLAADGTVRFSLNGANTELGATISAEVKVDDLSNLVQAINEETETTGITAVLSEDKRSVRLINEDGYDIKISNWTSTADDKEIQVLGATGAAAELTDGGVVTVGGKVSYNSDAMFSVVAADTTVMNKETNYSTKVSVDEINVSTRAAAEQAIVVLDGALNQVNSNRATLGAVQNRFDAAITNMQAYSENLSAARSRIRDTDFAEETSNMAIATILQQSGVSILAQANQLPNNVLSLLG